jgi:DNA-binding FadR family transcriptional regulator
MRRGLHGEIVDALGGRIVRGELAPGTVLPNEVDLCAELNVSRTVVREAIKVLASKGLVETRPKTGTRVLERDRWNILDRDVLHWQFEGDFDDSLYRDISEIRMIIEPRAAGLAANRRTDAEARQISELLEAMAASVDEAPAYISIDIEFHTAILRATQNLPLMQMTATVGAALEASRRVTVNVPGAPARAMAYHRAVGEAIRSGDVQGAVLAMEELIRANRDDARAAGCQLQFLVLSERDARGPMTEPTADD